MTKNKFNIGDLVEVKIHIDLGVKSGRVYEIYYDEDLKTNCYLFTHNVFVYTEEELKKIRR